MSPFFISRVGLSSLTALALISASGMAVAQEGVTAYCRPGASGMTACPCGNPDGGSPCGCPNSHALQGVCLGATGSAGPNLTLVASGMSTGTTGLFFQGTARISGGAGAVFGDGLRCVGGTVVRLGTTTAGEGVSTTFRFSFDLISQLGITPGSIRTYQLWYRNAADYCTPATFNLSNALEVSW